MDFIFDEANKKAYLILNENKTNIIGKVKLRGTNIIVNIVYISKNIPLMNTVKEAVPTQFYSLLKSNLQKQIRRQEITAITTASILLDLNAFELLRRLIIIAAEDVEISTETSVMTWLMMATSKGFILSPTLKNYVLNYVEALVKHPICRRLIINMNDYNDKLQISDVMSSSISSVANKSEIAAILLRTYYGGLEGDNPMLCKLCDEYLKVKRTLPSIIVKNIENKINLPKLQISDAAIDYHIYPNLLNLINKDTQIDVTTISRAIWICSSSINKRVNIITNVKYDEIWQKILPSFTFHTKEYLLKIMS